MSRRQICTLSLLALLPVAVSADGPEASFGVELKTNLRHSPERRFAVPFPFRPEQLPPGQPLGFMRSVDPGTHLEASMVTARGRLDFGEIVAVNVKLDFINLYDRNPTSSASGFDLDEAWVRIGRETLPGAPSPGFGVFLKLGKFGKPERQNDRHLESYGLVATAFNRFEDVEIVTGFDLGEHLYVRGSLTQGNSIFMRDPNALAGDNGLPELLEPNPDPELGTGIVIPYDADVRSLDFENPEYGGAAGIRFVNAMGDRAVDVMAFGYERDLDDTVEIKGSFYGGDLDLLLGPGNAFPFPLTGERKREWGGNLWLYFDDITLFGQFVHQDLAGLLRQGWEIEGSYGFFEPFGGSSDGAAFVSHVTPAVRFSRLDPDFAAPAVTPSPSFAWPWEKWDFGLRVGFGADSDLTIEYSLNEFRLGSGEIARNDEFLLTLRLAFERQRN